MLRVVFTAAAKTDIQRVIRYTRQRWGPQQVLAYRELILEARNRLEATPSIGHHREGLPPDGQVFHIGQPGKPASHFFLYQVVQGKTVVVLRMLHEAMDMPRHWPRRSEK
jgi:toxin ParE1/3/4